jgi:hypothetical protein
MNEKLREQAEEFAAWVAGFDFEAVRFATDIVRKLINRARHVWASDAPPMPRLASARPRPDRDWTFHLDLEKAPLIIGDG